MFHPSTRFKGAGGGGQRGSTSHDATSRMPLSSRISILDICMVFVVGTILCFNNRTAQVLTTSHILAGPIVQIAQIVANNFTNYTN